MLNMGFKKFLWDIIVQIGVFALGVVMIIFGVSITMVSYETKPINVLVSIFGIIVMFIGLYILYSTETRKKKK